MLNNSLSHKIIMQASKNAAKIKKLNSKSNVKCTENESY